MAKRPLKGDVMIKKPLPRGSGIGQAAQWEPVSKGRGRGAPAASAGARVNGHFLSLAAFTSPANSGTRRSPGDSVSNEMPTLATKSVREANLPHPLPVGISGKMDRAESVLDAAVHCALPRKDGSSP